MAERVILHVDMDAFFAAVEQREHPRLQGQPVVIGADPQGGTGRGVVSTASYEAREYGIHSAQPISEAYRRCPEAHFLPVRGELYRQVSRSIIDILRSYTDLVEPISVDEAFLDVTASQQLFGTGKEIAAQIKRDIRQQEQLTASVGVASSKFVAKVASDLEKPDGLTVVPAEEERGFLAPLSLEHLWGAGPKAIEKFHRIGVCRIGQVAQLPMDTLERLFKPSRARSFYRLSRGMDSRPVEAYDEQKSLGKEYTFRSDTTDRQEIKTELLGLCQKVARRLRSNNLAGVTVSVKLRFADFETHTHQKTAPQALDTTEQLWPLAQQLLEEMDNPSKPVRLVGVTVSNFVSEAGRQLSLFQSQDPQGQALSEAIDAIEDEHGRGVVTRAALLDDPDDGSRRG